MEKNCNNIYKQIKIYEKLKKELNIDENSNLYKQTIEKRNFMNELIELVKQNIKVCENSIGKKNDLIPKIISLKEIKDKKIIMMIF